MATIDLKNRDIFRQGANLLFSIAQFFVTFLPAFGIGIGIGDRSVGESSPVGPIYWAFFIWFLIFPACIAYGIYQALPTQRENEILRRIGLFTASGFIGVTSYALVAQFGGSDWILIAIFVWIQASLLSAYFRLCRSPASTHSKRAVYCAGANQSAHRLGQPCNPCQPRQRPENLRDRTGRDCGNGIFCLFALGCPPYCIPYYTQRKRRPVVCVPGYLGADRSMS